MKAHYILYALAFVVSLAGLGLGYGMDTHSYFFVPSTFWLIGWITGFVTMGNVAFGVYLHAKHEYHLLKERAIPDEWEQGA